MSAPLPNTLKPKAPLPSHIHEIRLTRQAAAEVRGAVGDQAPIERKGNDEFVIHRNKWNQWVSKNPVRWKGFQWNSFKELYSLQGNDGNASSLSGADLKALPVSGLSQEEAETNFTKAHGYPLQVFQNGNNLLIKMDSGDYWVGSKKLEGYSFRRLPNNIGEKLAIKIANRAIRAINKKFEQANLQQRLRMKTVGFANSIQKDTSVDAASKKTNPVFFANKKYQLPNENSKVAFRPGAYSGGMKGLKQYYRTQPQNGCLSASILNGVNFSAQANLTDPGLLKKFHQRMVSLQDSDDGRLSPERLIQDIQTGKIPGVRANWVYKKDVNRLVKKGIPVIALVPYYGGHAALVTKTGQENGKPFFQGIDTVTGMVFQESYQVLFKKGELDVGISPKLERELSQGSGLVPPTTFLSIDITDLHAFQNWLKTENHTSAAAGPKG